MGAQSLVGFVGGFIIVGINYGRLDGDKSMLECRNGLLATRHIGCLAAVSSADDCMNDTGYLCPFLVKVQIECHVTVLA